MSTDSNIVHSTLYNRGWSIDLVKTDSVEQFMPLTREGLPEIMQGLFWMDQWGYIGKSDAGSMECLRTVSPNFTNQKTCPARPDMLVSYAAMPTQQIGNSNVTVVAVLPNEVPCWSWFGLRYQDFSQKLAEVMGLAGSPQPVKNPKLLGEMVIAYKFVFNSDWTVGQIVPSNTRKLNTSYRFVVEHSKTDNNVWLRKSWKNPQHTGETYTYSMYRIVDGAGNHTEYYNSYLEFANLPEVCGTEFKNTTLLIRQLKPNSDQLKSTSNRRILDAMPYPQWPAWSDPLTNS